MVACVDDAILDLLDRNIVGKGVERPIFFLRGKKGFELGDLSLLEVELDSIATLRLSLVFRFFVFVLLCPAGQQRFTRASGRYAFAGKNTAITQIADELKNKCGKAAAGNTDQSYQNNRERSQT